MIEEKIIRYTMKELVTMPRYEFDMLLMCLESGTFRLLGIQWSKIIKWYWDKINGDIVIIYQ